MSLRSRLHRLEAAQRAGEDGERIAFFDVRSADGPITFNGEEFPNLEAAQASCGNKINCLLPLKLELADWIEAVEHHNNVTPAASGN